MTKKIKVRLDSIGEIVATRDLSSLTGKEITVNFGKPRKSEEGSYYCPVQIMGVGDSEIRAIHGEDAVQSLELAMRFVGSQLQHLQRAGGLNLSPGSIAFPSIDDSDVPFERRISDEQIERSIQENHKLNVTLRSQLQEQGVDFGEFRMIECHFKALNRDEAAQFGRSLNNRGYLVLAIIPVVAKQGRSFWIIEAGRQYPISTALSEEFLLYSVKSAAEFNVVYEGWWVGIPQKAK